ncbi:MAG: class I SAM-dependent methyltransferase [Phycisphaerales bacterium]|nr:class I SAM-dependent methyltransferase [Phycisphaerales bacterium]
MSQPVDPLTYFTGLADRYAANRPSYPPAAIEAILHDLPDSPRIADVGCGTGIATTLLAQAGALVIGIEPNDEMRSRAMSDLPPQWCCAVEFRKATAEATGLDDGSVHAVLCAQSFHWFDLDAALKEFHRILAPGGRLALMWNVRVPRTEMDRIYAKCVAQAQKKAKGEGRVLRRNYGVDLDELGPLFTDGRQLAWPNPQTCTLPTLLGKAASASYFPREPAAADALLKRLAQAFEQHQSHGFVEINQECRLTLATRC